VPRPRDILPQSLPPRGLSRSEAAAYVGVSPTLFDRLVADGRMPRPKRIAARTVWDRRALDLAFTEIPDGSDVDNPWDD
jgi:predicted DNA-binding transcriptional regulator AlpA